MLFCKRDGFFAISALADDFKTSLFQRGNYVHADERFVFDDDYSEGL